MKSVIAAMLGRLLTVRRPGLSSLSDAASRGSGPWCGRPTRRGVLRSRRGVAAVEFALIAPILIVVVIAAAEFSIYLVNFVRVTNVAGAGARQLAISRPSSTPWAATTTAISSAAAGLDSAQITYTASIGATSCSSDSGCKTLLSGNIGSAATVVATYPCSLPFLGWGSGCTVSAQASEIIQ